MTTVLVTLTGDVSDAISVDFTTAKAYVRHNTPTIVTDSGPIRLGGGLVDIETDGTFSLSDVVASTSLVENLQATVYVDYADSTTRERAVATFGPYDLSAETGTVDIRDLEAVQALDPSFASETMDAMQALLDAQILISGIDDTDSAVAALIEDDLVGPLTNAALSASFPRAGIVSPGVNGITGLGVTVDRVAIQAVLDANDYVWVDPGIYLLDDRLTVPSDTTIQGPGRSAIFRSTTNPANGGTGIGHRLFDATSKTGFRLADFHIDMSPMTTFLSGVRDIWLSGSSDFVIDGVTHTTPGAGYAAINCHDYLILNPVADIVSTDSTAKHDGVFDQWDGCHDFEIINAKVYGNGIGKYGVLVTGENTAGTASACYNFTITTPKVYDVIQVGVLINGREGINHSFTLVNPLVDGSDLHCIAISDCDDWTMSSPIAKNAAYNGIRVFSETTVGGATGGRHGTITGPVVINANQIASGSSIDGAAIAITDNSLGITVTNERVSGTTHTYGVTFGPSTTKCNHVRGSVDAGTLGKWSNDPNVGTYTPTSTNVANVTSSVPLVATWSRVGDLVTVMGRITITPTVGATTATQVGVSLPIASNLASINTDVQGLAATSFGQIAAISADVTNDRAQIQFPAPGTAGYIFTYEFTYKVL